MDHPRPLLASHYGGEHPYFSRHLELYLGQLLVDLREVPAKTRFRDAIFVVDGFWLGYHFPAHGPLHGADYHEVGDIYSLKTPKIKLFLQILELDAF